jgi:aspartate kinase
MLITIKFGGTSVGDAERIRSAAQLVASQVAQGRKVAVVTSAMSGVTNKLVALLDEAKVTGTDDQQRITQYFRFAKSLENDHTETARRAIKDPQLFEQAANILYSERHALERVLIGSHFLGELTPIGYDFIVSQGERMCVPILANCLKDLGVDAVGIGGEGCGIMTDSNYGNARPLEKETRTEVRRRLVPILESGKVPVMGGFFGHSPQGRIAILGRGGSDYSATLVGCALDAGEIWIMTDVDGIKTTDPRIVPAAHTVHEMPYLLAAEMSLLGAKVLHPKSVLPAAKQGVPVRVASSFEPEKPGTRLVPSLPDETPRVVALTLVRHGTLIRLSSPELGSEPVVGADLNTDLRRQNVDFLASASTANGGNALWLIGPLETDRFLVLLEQHKDATVPSEIHRDVAVLAVIGERVATATGIIALLVRCLDEVGTQPLAILQGASPNSVVVALPDDEKQLPTTLKILHTRFELDEETAF